MDLAMIHTLGAAGGSWVLPAMVLVPLLGALLLIGSPEGRDGMYRGTTLLTTLVVLLLGLCAAGQFDWALTPTADAPYQLSSAAPWVEMLGVRLSFGIDSVALWLVLLTAVLMPITILGSFGDDTRGRTREFYAWLLVLESALLGVFTATDVILFYVFFELTLVPLFFLIGIFGSGNRHYAAMKFFVFTLTGSLLTLAAVIYVAYFNAAQTGFWTFNIPQLTEAAKAMSNVNVTIHIPAILSWLPLVPAQIDTTAQHLVLAGLLCGFAVKVPLFPVHTWLPLAHTEAPTAGSVVLAGVLLKLGGYGLYRFALPMAPVAVLDMAPTIAVFCIIGIIYTALICWVQSDVKKLVAYSSVSHMGFCILGLFALNTAGVGGSVMYMINHGLSTGALFLCIGMIYNRFHTREMAELGGLGKRMPVWSSFFVFFCFASVGLPGLNGFVGEFLTVFGTYTSSQVLGIPYAAVAALGFIFGAIYILYMVGRVVMGPVKDAHGSHAHGHDHGHGPVSDLNLREIVTLAPLAVACLVLGLYPTPMLRSFEGSIDRTTGPVRAAMEYRAAHPTLGDATPATDASHVSIVEAAR
ncbi:MAG: NADH-quinone oxidoreductase subunit M [Planctomycetes bacterium]|nr:NADH-quinone oxidoreductase subunit M [Planctomycetota bacterium]